VIALGLSLFAGSAQATIIGNPGFSSGNYSVCNYPNAGDGASSYGPDENYGADFFSSNWKCGWTGSSGFTWGRASVPVGATFVLTKNNLETPDFGTGALTHDLSSVAWDFNSDGITDYLDSGPWPWWKLNRGFPYTKGQQFSASHIWSTPGTKTVSVTATLADGSSETSTGTIEIVPDTVSPFLQFEGGTVARPQVIQNKAVHFNAGMSTSLSGHISRYEWDLDGDGSFETDGGANPDVITRFPSTGAHIVTVRVTSAGGSTATASLTSDVFAAPPAGETGVSIEDGASYTNSKNVNLSVVWPEYATAVRISNDGGFSSAKTVTRDLSSTINWALDDSVVGLYTKTVYVRFSGDHVDTTKTYSDDIILDNTAPTIQAASTTSSSGTGLALASYQSATQATFVFAPISNSPLQVTSAVAKPKAKTKTVKIAIRAKDNLSGVKNIAVSRFANKTKASITAYSPTKKISVPTATKALYVRVQDGAGNWSKWKTLAVR
jgi:hypothetical protein